MELTNALRKETSSLAERKWRKRLGLFKCEGTKCVGDTLDAFILKSLFATESWVESHPDIASAAGERLCLCRRKDIVDMSSLSTPADVIAVYRIPDVRLDHSSLDGRLVLALDGIQDPGNLGTIMRTADWFGVSDILCSADTADVYNPKTIQSTMGAISRVKVHYCDLPDILRRIGEQMPVYGTFLEGESIYASPLAQSGIIIMGNEGKGISPEVAAIVTDRLHIPSGCGDSVTSESLNVASATAIVLSEFFRRTI